MDLFVALLLWFMFMLICYNFMLWWTEPDRTRGSINNSKLKPNPLPILVPAQTVRQRLFTFCVDVGIFCFIIACFVLATSPVME